MASAPEAPSLGRAEDPAGPAAPHAAGTPASGAGVWGVLGALGLAGTSERNPARLRTVNRTDYGGKDTGDLKSRTVRASSGGWETANTPLLGNRPKLPKPQTWECTGGLDERARGHV